MAFNPIKKSKLPREVPGQGGYVYRQHPDGEIEILSAPSFARRGESRVLAQPKPVAMGGKAWRAITEEIGEYGAKNVASAGLADDATGVVLGALIGGLLGYRLPPGIRVGGAVLGGVLGYVAAKRLTTPSSVVMIVAPRSP